MRRTAASLTATTPTSPRPPRQTRGMRDAMTRAGFTGYSAEWWHYTDTDAYDVVKALEPLPWPRPTAGFISSARPPTSAPRP
ncbi:MAG: M15 family metallopeptidase [Oscillospiraceae bacterium]